MQEIFIILCVYNVIADNVVICCVIQKECDKVYKRERFEGNVPWLTGHNLKSKLNFIKVAVSPAMGKIQSVQKSLKKKKKKKQWETL